MHSRHQTPSEASSDSERASAARERPAKSIFEQLRLSGRTGPDGGEFVPDGSSAQFRRTDALPGTFEKLEILRRRVEQGLPLWHPADRHSVDDYSDD